MAATCRCTQVSVALAHSLLARSAARPAAGHQRALSSHGIATCQRHLWRAGAQRRCLAAVPAVAAAAAAGEQQRAGQHNSVLFLSPVWPERSSSAAGVRTGDLIAAFQRQGWAAAYASPSAPNEHTALLAAAGVATFQCQLNRERQLAEILEAVRPTAVVFDRYYAEEAFSFRVRELAPAALRVLDMQDMHALRAARQQAAEGGAPLHEVLACRPDATQDDLLRELAAIHRSDLTLVCSPVELELLTRHYGVPASKLVLAPFFAPPSPYAPPGATTSGSEQQPAAAGNPAGAACPSFGERKNFIMIGNWRHPPNLDSARWTCSEVWPALRAELPPEHRDAELHLYGAYPAGAAQQLHRPKAGVHMKGFAPSLDIMLQYRVLLAPLRYGAGLKGKVVDSWWHGLPVVTTPIGSEGMTAADAQPGDLTATGMVQAPPPAAASDPAQEGYVWQLGGSSSSSSSSSKENGSSSNSGRQQVAAAPDPASEGHAWQLGGSNGRQQGVAALPGSAAEGLVWQLGGSSNRQQAAATVPDLAADGPVWQQGGSSNTSNLSSRPLDSSPAVALPDLAAEGHVWQVGGSSNNAGIGQQLTAAALPDPAAVGNAWQMGGNSFDGSATSHKTGGQGELQQQAQQQEEWGGLCGATTAAGITGSAALLYSNQQLWERCQQRGFELLRLLYDQQRNLDRVTEAVAAVTAELDARRQQDYAGAMLWQQQLRATEYFSRWLELKEAAAAAKQERQAASATETGEE